MAFYKSFLTAENISTLVNCQLRMRHQPLDFTFSNLQICYSQYFSIVSRKLLYMLYFRHSCNLCRSAQPYTIGYVVSRIGNILLILPFFIVEFDDFSWFLHVEMLFNFKVIFKFDIRMHYSIFRCLLCSFLNELYKILIRVCCKLLFYRFSSVFQY